LGTEKTDVGLPAGAGVNDDGEVAGKVTGVAAIGKGKRKGELEANLGYKNRARTGGVRRVVFTDEPADN
jgi:hypothetical protein